MAIALHLQAPHQTCERALLLNSFKQTLQLKAGIIGISLLQYARAVYSNVPQKWLSSPSACGKRQEREISALTLAKLCRQGLQYRLEVFKDPHKGWAVRSWDQIPALAYVASFHGQVLAAKSCPDMDEAYAFDLGLI